MVPNSCLTTAGIKFSKFFEELKTCGVNLCQTRGVILLLGLLCSYRSPKARFTELAEQGLHHYYRIGFKYLNLTDTFKILYSLLLCNFDKLSHQKTVLFMKKYI